MPAPAPLNAANRDILRLPGVRVRDPLRQRYPFHSPPRLLLTAEPTILVSLSWIAWIEKIGMIPLRRSYQ